MPDVIVVGAGPVGMLLATELARRGVDARVLDRRPGPGEGSRAVGLHATALAALGPSGAAARILATAHRVQRGEARTRGRVLGVVRFDRLRTQHPFVATTPQAATVAALAEAAAHAGVAPVVWDAVVERVVPAEDGAVVRWTDATGAVHDEFARVVVVAAGSTGADVSGLRAGARRTVYPDRYLMADVADTGPDGAVAVIHLDPDGVLESFPLPGGLRRYVAWMPAGVPTRDPDVDGGLLRAAVAVRTGCDAAAESITTATGFGVRRTLVRRMRSGPVFVIGDAAHEVSPIGGQGMNLGILDAATLAPLVARWIGTDTPPENDLAEWERRRRRGAALSGAIAAANTRVGRAASALPDAVRRGILTGIFHSPAERALAKAYSMGFDPDAHRALPS